ncbi:catalase family protein [Microbulbifer pacificus]|uniref:Catalase family protein n=1 Tax=Microbulbifer pacificus TaxID=407164 RepID=A0AAU0MY19_9GAMM|nr:catalase family protein [Microbulbifer pacificus]WOX05100.1 catalase family protein [Microbulbifer pacificus]
MMRKSPRQFTPALVLGLSLCASASLAGQNPQDHSDTLSALDASIQQLGMDISSEERAAIASVMQTARDVSRAAQKHNSLRYGDEFRRDAHAKATGCVRAEFEVNGDIPAQFRHSVFAEPGRRYPAWIRFSNGDMLVQADGEKDARGMAVKLMGVDGVPIAPELGDSATQDFLMANNQAFFNRNIHDYVENMQYLARLDKRGWFFGLWPPRLHLKQMIRGAQTVSSTIDTPLQEPYFSILPYRLGDTQLKFASRPCPGADYPITVDQNAENFLTEQLSDSLQSGSACFDFLVQPRNISAETPLDDATVIWEEKDSPFIPVARIHIPPQTFTSEAQWAFCENLSMNPWRGVGEWEPLGSLNRARRLAYHAVSDFRHTSNDAPQREPTDWCVPGETQKCTPQQGLNVYKPSWPLPRCFDAHFNPADDKAVSSQCQGYGVDSGVLAENHY